MQPEDYMRRCLVLAREALASGNPPVGSVLVVENEIIGEGREAGKSSNDITKHAEIEAIRDCIENGQKSLLAKATMYTTHEPCIMCSYVIRHHRIPMIVGGCAVPEVGGFSSPLKVLSSSQIGKWGAPPKVSFGLLKEECSRLMLEFENQQTRKY